MKMFSWMKRKNGRKARRKKHQAAEQASVSSVAADGTMAPQTPVELKPTASLQRPLVSAGEEVYYDAQETLSDFGDAEEDTIFPNLLRRLSSAKRPPSKAHDRPRHDLPVVIDQQGNQVIEVEPGVTAPADAVLGTAGSQPLSAPGCLSLFNSAAASNKYFVRTSKPAAGASLNKQDSGAGGMGSWDEPDATSFMIRGSDYMKTKRKVNSEPGIYKLINVDMYSFDMKLNHIAKHLRLPAANTMGPAAQMLPPNERLPPLLLINLQLPTYPASLFGTQDGKGLSLVYYFALPEGWEPADVPNSAALEMLQRFFHDGKEFDNTRTRDRLKLIPRVSNLDEWATAGQLSGAEQKLLHKYNDKPLLTKPQHHFYQGPNYFEIDLNVHSYAYLARKAFASYLPRLDTVVFETAFVVQGNRPEELPEVVLGAGRIYRTDFMQPRPFPARLTRSSTDVSEAV